MLKLIVLKTIIFNIFTFKAFVAESAILMGILSFVPHVQVINAATTVDYSISNITFPVQSAPGDTVVFSYYFQSQDEWINGSSVIVESDIPEWFTYLSASANPTIDTSNNTVTRNIPEESDLQWMVIVRFTVDEDAPAAVTNTVSVSHAWSDPVSANDEASATIFIGWQWTVQADADLVVQKTVNNNNPLLIDDIAYTISYTNQGTQPATNVVIYDMVPFALSDSSIITTPAHTQILDGNIYQWNIGTVGPWAAGQITIAWWLDPIIQGSPTVTNHVMITSDIIEENTDNNFDDVSLVVDPGEPNLYIDMVPVQSKNVCIWDSAEYIIDIGNDGRQPASNVYIQITIPQWLQPSDFIPQPTNNSSDTYTRQLTNDLYPGENTAIMFSVNPTVPAVDLPTTVVIQADDIPSQSQSLQLQVQDCWSAWDDDDDDITPVYGCTNSSYDNYNSNATHDNGTCANNESWDDDDDDDDDEQTKIFGCTDPDANNYKASATHSNGTCTFDEVWDDDDDDDDDEQTKIFGCTDHTATNYNAKATNNNGTCKFPPQEEPDETVERIFGCTDHRALNHNVKATHNNGTCIFPKKDTTPTIIYTTNPITPQVTSSPVPPVIQQKPIIRRDQAWSTECDIVMDDMFVYAKNMGIISSDTIQDANLCKPIPRMYFAKMLTETVLNLAIPEPSLQNRCSFDDIKWLPTDIQFYIRLSCELRLMGVDDKWNPQQNFRPNDNVTVAEVAKIFSNILFGDQYNSADNRYQGHLQAMYDAFLIRSIDDPHREIRKWHIIKVIQRMDYGNVAQATKYLRRRSQNK